MADTHERVELEKSLSPANIWAVALGSIIGWGAFIQSPNWMVKPAARCRSPWALSLAVC